MGKRIIFCIADIKLIKSFQTSNCGNLLIVRKHFHCLFTSRITRTQFYMSYGSKTFLKINSSSMTLYTVVCSFAQQLKYDSPYDQYNLLDGIS